MEEAGQSDAVVVEGYKKVSDDGDIVWRKYKYEIFEGANVKNSFLPRMIGSYPEKDSIFYNCMFKNYISEK